MFCLRSHTKCYLNCISKWDNFSINDFSRWTKLISVENAESVLVNGKDFWDLGNTEVSSNVSKYKLIDMEKERKLLPTKQVQGSTIGIYSNWLLFWGHQSKLVLPQPGWKKSFEAWQEGYGLKNKGLEYGNLKLPCKATVIMCQ